MFKTKRILGIIITFALLFSVCTNCYAIESMPEEGLKNDLEVSTEEKPKTEEAVKEEVPNDTVNAGEDNNSNNKENSSEATAGASKGQAQKSNEEKLIEKAIEEKIERYLEKYALGEMEKEYRAERNRIANAGDTTVLVLKTITVVSIISLIVIIVWNKKIKK